MPKDDFNSNTQHRAPIFESFQWHRQEVDQIKVSGHMYSDLAGKVRDITSGCATILELIEFDYLRGTGGEKPLMSDGEKGDLTRLAIQSLRMLNDNADEGITWVFDHCTEAGKAEIAKGLSNHE